METAEAESKWNKIKTEYAAAFDSDGTMKMVSFAMFCKVRRKKGCPYWFLRYLQARSKSLDKHIEGKKLAKAFLHAFCLCCALGPVCFGFKALNKDDKSIVSKVRTTRAKSKLCFFFHPFCPFKSSWTSLTRLPKLHESCPNLLRFSRARSTCFRRSTSELFFFDISLFLFGTELQLDLHGAAQIVCRISNFPDNRCCCCVHGRID